MSTLFERMMVPCKTRVLDGNAYKDGVALDAAIVKNTSFEARIAEQQTGRSVYTITTHGALPFGSVVKRNSDGATFRVTSRDDGSSPPAEASFSFHQVSAESWVEPT